ncbi:DUF4383 domain-containing protein [Azospirillum thermophilum]|uniref:DUF4383 domain-containing protein n=1 Tax=Azospirillum thermophilum TaxID=2202148 RepID=A0A2S2CX69_9PROT|nr:DUF4383 domain-containing protein [Azospirillum thermophilum]AWK89086.1 DUF4383 domain-containing protein [Azospirillum thermophilum]
MWWRNVTLVFAVVFTAVGLLGFIPSMLSPPAAGDTLAIDSFHGLLLGLFPVNVLHNIVHLAFGLWAFFAYFSGRLASRGYLRTVAVLYILLAVMGIIPGLNTLFGLVPLHGNDVWLHVLIAAVAGAVGYLVHEPETDRDRATYRA